MTGWNLSTAEDKELIGNSDGGGQYDITLTNSIFAQQPASDQPSLWFTTDNLNGDNNELTFRNIVLYEVNAPDVRDGSDPIDYGELTDNPQFADPENEDFTIGNTAYLTGGDDGSVIGARYWHPDFVDDFSDLLAIDRRYAQDIDVSVYPQPFKAEVNFEITLESAENVTIAIVDVTGRTIKFEAFELTAGSNIVVVNTSDIAGGTYFYTVTTSEGYSTGNLIKTN
jgi:hypothetical protein